MKNNCINKSVCVYCGASDRVDGAYLELAYNMGKALADASYNMVYGGGKTGLMGRAADGVIANNGYVTGITTTLLTLTEGYHEGLLRINVVETMHTRKFEMAEKADAFVILPGGIGTLDEFFEIVTWRYLKTHNKPIIVLNYENFWDPLENLYNHLIETKFGPPYAQSLVSFVNSTQQVIEALHQQLNS